MCSNRSLSGLALWSFRAQDGACFKDNAFEDGEATNLRILMELQTLYLVGGLEHFIFFHILGIIIPIN